MMKNKKKLFILLGVAAASFSLTGCDQYISGKEYANKVNELALIIKEDMKEVGLDIYKFDIIASTYSAEDYYLASGEKGQFLAFPNDIIVSNVSSGEEKSLIVYTISDNDYAYVDSLTKSGFTHQDGDVAYHGALDGIIDVLNNETSTLYSVKNLTTNEVLYTIENPTNNYDNLNF